MSKIKINFKKVLLIIMLLIMSVGFCACGELNSSIITNENGSIDEIVTINLDAEKIEELGYSEVEIENLKANIRLDALSEADKMKQNLNNKISMQLSMFELTNEAKEILNSYYNGITVKESNWSDNAYSIKVQFKNIDVYKYYYDIDDNITVTQYKEEHFLYNKIYWYGNTMYFKHRELYQNLKTKYEISYPNLIDCENAKLTYTYCVTQRRQHSDANSIQYSNGKYYHTWEIDKDNPNQKIMFYYNIANAYNWILISLVISLFVAGILTLIVIIKKDKKINKNQ